VKVWLALPDVTIRITHPARALVVVNCTLPVVAPVAIVSEAGIVNAELDDSSLATVGEVAGVPSETTQLPEIPGVRTVGMQDSDNGLVSVGATREMAAVNLAVPRAAVMAALCEVVIVAVDAVKVAETALAGTVKVPGTVNRDGRLLERETATPPTGAALERVTVQVVLAAEAKLAAAH
jgi:translation initiation factor 6 (eIF-6)